MAGFGNLPGSTPMECAICRAPLLAKTLWHEGVYPKWRCGTLKITGTHQSGRCWWRALFMRKNKLKTREQELAEETLAMDRAAAEIEFEREMKKARAELEAETP